MIITDGEGRIIRWGAEAQSLLGFKPDQVLGRSFVEAVSARDVYGNRLCPRGCGLRATIERGETPRTFEIEVETATGGRLRVFVSIVPEGRRDRMLYELRADLRRRTDRRSIRDRRHPLAAPAAKGGNGNAHALSRRELDVLRCLAAGGDTRDIAAQLGISQTTVRNHTQNLLRKLGVHSRVEAVSMAFRHQFI